MRKPLVELVADFCTPLRMGEGIDEVALRLLEETMRSLRAEWSGSIMVPREDAGALAELVLAMDAASYLYPADQAEHIRGVAADLSEQVSAMFFDEG